jgi:hypothetical protein
MTFCLHICLIKEGYVFFLLISISFGCMSQMVCGVVHIDSCVWVMFEYKCKSFGFVTSRFGFCKYFKSSGFKINHMNFQIHVINFDILKKKIPLFLRSLLFQ